MTKTVYELEQELEQAKKREKQERLQHDLEEAIKNYKGKCYCTHLLGRKWNKHITISLIRVVDVIISNEEILYKIENVSYSKSREGNVNFNSNQVTHTSPRHAWELFRYEITEKQYVSVVTKAQAQLDIIGEMLREGMNTPVDYIDGITQTEDKNHEELLVNANIPLIKLPTDRTPNNNASIAEMLGWYHHPFIYCGKYLVNSAHSKRTLELIIEKLTKNMYSWGSAILVRDKPRVDALTDFLKSTKWLT